MSERSPITRRLQERRIRHSFGLTQPHAALVARLHYGGARNG